MARLFNGTSESGSIATLNLSAFTQVTISLWLNNYSTGAVIGFCHNEAGGTFKSLYFRPSNASNIGEIGQFDLSGHLWSDTFPRASLKQWHHYLLTYDHGAPLNKVWVDGVAQTLTLSSHTALTDAGSLFPSGSLQLARYSGGQFANAAYGELAVWGGVLLGASDAQALANKARADAWHPANFVGYYPIAGGQSPEPDISGQGANGITLTGSIPVQGPIYTLQAAPPAMPPILRGHPAMRRHRAFFASRPPAGAMEVIVVAFAGTSSLAASLTPYHLMTVTLAGSSSLASTVTAYHRITVTLAGAGTLAAAIVPYKRLTVSIAGTSTLTGTITPYERLTVAIAGTSSLTGTLTPYKRLTMSLAGTSSLAASLTPYQRVTVSLAGTSTLTATATTYKRLTIALAGSSTLGASFTALHNFTVSLAGSSSLASVLTRYQLIAPTVAGASSLSATVTRLAAPIAIAPRLAGTSTLTAGIVRYQRFNATVGGAAALTLTLKAIGVNDGRPVSGLTMTQTSSSLTATETLPSSTDADTAEGLTQAPADGSETFAPVGG